MANRNIAIALFDPECSVDNSNWPRFTGWKQIGKPYIESGLFGLVDKNTRMHRFFKNTTIKYVLTQQVRYKQRGIDVRVRCAEIDFNKENGGTVLMPLARIPDNSIKWLTPYTYTTVDGIEWDVYPIVTGADIFIVGDFQLSFKTDGYWDMGIWKPSEQEMLSDIFRIEQATINHVVSLGHPAMTPVTYDECSPEYRTYKQRCVHQDLPDLSKLYNPEEQTN